MKKVILHLLHNETPYGLWGKEIPNGCVRQVGNVNNNPSGKEMSPLSQHLDSSVSFGPPSVMDRFQCGEIVQAQSG